MVNMASTVPVDARNSYEKYADCMSDTTIRLDSAVRDKLRALAEEDHVTLGDLLARLAEREQYQREMPRERGHGTHAARGPTGMAGLPVRASRIRGRHGTRRAGRRGGRVA